MSTFEDREPRGRRHSTSASRSGDFPLLISPQLSEGQARRLQDPDEKTAYDEYKRKRRGVAEGVYRDCFCDSSTVAKKRRVPDYFHGGDDAGLLPKMIKHE